MEGGLLQGGNEVIKKADINNHPNFPIGVMWACKKFNEQDDQETMWNAMQNKFVRGYKLNRDSLVEFNI